MRCASEDPSVTHVCDIYDGWDEDDDDDDDADDAAADDEEEEEEDVHGADVDDVDANAGALRCGLLWWLLLFSSSASSLLALL